MTDIPTELPPPPATDTPLPRSRKFNAGLLVMIYKIAAKFGAKILAAIPKLLKGLKFGKVALAVGSAATYTWLFSWQFAAMLMLALIVHESGHIWAMKKCGLKTKGIYFIPFIGAMAVSESEFPTRGAEAFIAIMGPIWGLALALLVAGVFLVTGHHLFAAAAAWMAMINLFNLLPVNPLDGGRMVKSIAFSVSSILGTILLVVGILAALVLMFYWHIFLFAFLLVIGTAEMIGEWNQWRNWRKAQNPKTGLPLADMLPEDSVWPPRWCKKIRALDGPPVTQKFDKFQRLPSMDRRTLFLAIFSYLTVAGLLWALMYITKHIPDANGAADVFK